MTHPPTASAMKKKTIITILAVAALAAVFLLVRYCGDDGAPVKRPDAGRRTVSNDPGTGPERISHSADQENAPEERAKKEVKPDAADARAYWFGEWKCSDDWKTTTDYLTLTRDKGQFYLVDSRDPNEPVVFVYDEESRMFFFERDFYGKTIIDEVVFTDKDNLVMTKRSGRKEFPEKYARFRH